MVLRMRAVSCGAQAPAWRLLRVLLLRFGSLPAGTGQCCRVLQRRLTGINTELPQSLHQLPTIPHMRFLLALLLCLAIPLQGWAAGRGASTPCPMAATMAMQTSAGSVDMNAATGDCCNDAVTAALTGKLCKTGQECPTPTGAFVASAHPAVSPLPTAAVPAFFSSAPPSGAADSVWRPPTI